LKVNQFNRQNPGQWMNNVVASQQQMKQQLNKGMTPHGGGPPKYGGGTPYSRATKNSHSPIDNAAMMQQQPGARMPMWNHQVCCVKRSERSFPIRHARVCIFLRVTVGPSRHFSP